MQMTTSFSALALAALALAGALSAQVSYRTASLDGTQEVPPNASARKGYAIVRLTEPANTVDCFVHSDLAGTAAHLHLAPVGVNGAIILPLSGGPLRWTGSGTFSAAQVTALKAGGVYANVHSAAFPGGEIRGQVVESTTTRYMTTLAGTKEVPPNSSTATGTLVAFLHEPDNVLVYDVHTTGLVATAAHFHLAPVGVNGPIIVTLNGGPSSYCGVTPKLTAAQLTALRSGGLYVNVHTAAFPGGEIRGQITAEVGDFGGWMDGSQMVPPVQTNGDGQACLNLNPDGTVTYRVIGHGVGSRSADVRLGTVGQNGPVVFSLERGGGNIYQGTSRVLTPAELDDLRQGRHYVRLDSNTNPDGEIRGQLRPIRMPEHYGAGCPGGGGRVAEIGTDLGPCMGLFLPISLHGAAPNQPAVLVFGGTRLDPLSLTSIGMANCYLFHDIAGVFFNISTDATGCGRALVELPFDFRFPGITLQSSFYYLDPGAPGIGLASSNAMSFTVQ